MRPLSLSLRGSIGLASGIGLEEALIDYTQFAPGLIAFAGRKGTGKTTLLDNSQPFRQLAFREGNLKNHFYLKDSHRIFKFLFHGDEFESRMLIDGKTGAGEAYLFHNGKPVNDGKVTTYDSAIRELLGSEKLFFNSVYSKQFGMGLGSLDPSELKMLFYELLNYHKYEQLHKTAKQLLTEYTQRQKVVEGEIKLFQDQIDNITVTKDDIELLVAERTDELHKVSMGEKAIERLNIAIDEAKEKLMNLRQKNEENVSISNKLESLYKEISEIEKNAETEMKSYEFQKSEELKKYEEDNPHQNRLKELRTQKNVEQEKADLEIRNLAIAIDELNKKLADVGEKIVEAEKVIARSEKIKGNKELIDTKVKEKKELTEQINLLIMQEKKIIETKSQLQEESAKKKEEITRIESEHRDTKNKISELEKDIEQLTKDKADKETALENFIAENGEIVKIVDGKPCGDELANVCPVLKYVNDRNAGIPAEKEKLRAAIQELSTKIEKLNSELTGKKEQSVKEEEELDAIQKAYFNNYTVEIEEKDGALTRIANQVKEATGKLAKLNEDDWEKLQKESENAENTIKAQQENITRLTELKNEYYKQKEEKTLRKTNIQKELSDKLQVIEKDVLNLNTLMKNEKQNIEEKYKEKIENANKNKEVTVNRLKKDVNELEQKFDPEVTGKITQLEIELERDQKEKTDTQETIKLAQINISNFDEKIGQMKQQLGMKEANLQKIESKKAELKYMEREIIEYTMLASAWDKKGGVPVLKLDNAGPEVSQFTNELLSTFEYPFRINLVTTEPTADGKKFKETLRIKVLEENKEIFANKEPNLTDKSGGQQVEIGTALQLAVSLIAKKQGQHFDTIYLDEKDGSLDSESSLQYLRMINRLHDMAGVYYTMLISHRPELLEMIPQRIELSREHGIQIINEAA